jgi:polyisoprenoid-binding protein YceI
MNHKVRYQIISLLLITALLAACQSKAVKNMPPPSAPTQDAAFDKTGTTRYQVDAGASELHILVFRGGALARLGHNHVVSSKDLSGVLWLHDDLSRSRIELTMPVAKLDVDDPKARANEGEEFSAEVPRDAREGTRSNLLRAEVLDGEHFPTVTLRSTKIGGTRAKPELTMRITIKGVSRDVLVPAVVREVGGRLTATGEFSVKQSDFGMTPFSVAMGALQVVDQLRVKFSIVCLQQQ